MVMRMLKDLILKEPRENYFVLMNISSACIKAYGNIVLSLEAVGFVC